MEPSEPGNQNSDSQCQYHIIKANIEHLPEISHLFNQYRIFYEQDDDLQLAKNFLKERLENNESIIFIALNADNNGLGFTQLYPSLCSVAAKPFITLYDLYVKPSARKMGLGRALMVKARQFAVKKGYSRIDLETAIDNHIAQKLYESLGYEKDNEYYKYSLDIQ